MGGIARRIGRIIPVVAALLVLAGPAGAADLYRARAIVTGQGEESRADGFARCLVDVLVKVSGDPRLAADPRVAALAGKAGDLVASFDYRDRMAGIPMHDEQGSRDRPHDLTVDFAPDRIDAALRALGSAPWPGPRPRLLVRVAVRNGETGFPLTRDGPHGRDMREALAAAADRYGMEIALPTQADTGAPADGDLPLAGTLVWSPGALGWVAEWHIETGAEPRNWTIDGVSFDEAFRNGIGGAALILSGNGAPG